MLRKAVPTIKMETENESEMEIIKDMFERLTKDINGIKISQTKYEDKIEKLLELLKEKREVIQNETVGG